MTGLELSHDAFVERIKDSRNVAANWPFGGMLHADDWRDQYQAPVGFSTRAGRDHLVVVQPKVITQRSVGFIQDRRPYYGLMHAQLTMECADASAAAAWEQMRGITLALRVQTTAERSWTMEHRKITVLSIAGVEQPLLPGELVPGVEHPNPAAQRMAGYIQGRIMREPSLLPDSVEDIEDYDEGVSIFDAPDNISSSFYDIDLLTSDDCNVTLLTSNPEVIGDEASGRVMPTAGSYVRAMVDRDHEDPNMFCMPASSALFVVRDLPR